MDMIQVVNVNSSLLRKCYEYFDYHNILEDIKIKRGLQLIT
jgi:hypothetical protein